LSAKRILLVTQWWPPEPDSSRGLPFARWLLERGHDVKVITGFPNYPAGRLYPGYKLKFKQWDETDGVPVLRVPLYPNHDQSASKRIVNYASFAASATAIGMSMLGKVDVVYAMATPPTAGLPAWANKVLRSVPYLFNVTDLYPEAVLESGMLAPGLKQKMIRGAVNQLCRTVYGNAAFVTAISRGYRDILIRRGLEPDRVHAVFNWVDEKLFRPVPRDEALAKKLGLDGKFNFIYAGNFGPLQGVDTIIRAAARLKHLPDVQIALIGTGQLEMELRQLAQDIGATNVHFTGRLDQTLMPEVYALADVLLVHLNDSEYLRATVPSKTQVSLAVGRPVVIASIGDSADIIKEANAGLVCEPKQPEGLAEAMLTMYNMPAAERETLAANGRRYYLDVMSMDRGAHQIESLLLRAS
jgi:colanic acid biosynthesis glycosyl transferase WcaI